MSNEETIRTPCNRCGNAFLVYRTEYEAENGQVYCEDCLVPVVCASCERRVQTLPEKVDPDSSLICRECEQRTHNRSQGHQTRGGRQCVVCGETTADPVVFEESPDEPVCQGCAPRAAKALRESTRGLIAVLTSALGHFAMMALYLFGSLAVAQYVSSRFDLVWWMFFVVIAIILLGGAQLSQIFEPREIIDLGLATAIMSVAIWVATGNLDQRLTALFGIVIISGLIIHELAHKAVGLGFETQARFEAFYTLNLASLALAQIVGIVILAPGAVKFDALTDRAVGIVAAAGPISNFLLAFVFLFIGDSFADLARLGILLNLGMAGFNMLPVPPLDGAKVYRWNRLAFAIIVVCVGIFGYFAVDILL